tara:strand:+ start:51 stop:479 length:429 start_codon:yes stop_codon:yes gene_type:complete
MKSFKYFITEAQGIDLRTSGGVPYDINDAEVKSKINAILGHTAVSEFLNPKSAINQMEAKLALLGLSRTSVPSEDPRNEVSDVEFSEGKGSFSMPFSKYGQIMGKSVDTPIDEIEKEEIVYNLNIRYEQLETGSYKVYGELS